MSTYVGPYAICPHCLHRNNGAMNVPGLGDGPPQPGDVGICGNCVGLFEYTEEGDTGTALLSNDIRVSLARDPQVIAAQVALRVVNKKRQR